MSPLASMRQSTIIMIIGFVLLWNSGFIGAEVGLSYSGPFSLLFWRYLGLTLLLLIYLLARKRLRWVGWSAAAPNMLVGVLAHGGWLSCVLLAQYCGVPPGIVALVVALQPMTTGAFSGLAVGEPTPIFRWIGLAIGFGGVVMTVVSRINFESTESIFAYLIPLGSVISITIASLIQRRMDVHHTSGRLPVDLTLFYQSLATTLAITLPVLAFDGSTTQWENTFIFTMIWLVIGVSLGAYTLMWELIERMDATRVASLFYLGPPITMLMAWIAFGDTLKVMDVAGLLVVFTGVLMTQIKPASLRKINTHK